MSGRSEARLLIKDSGKLGETAVARRVERLFAVEVALAPVVGAPGSQQEEQGDCWVTLSGATSDKTEKAKSYILSLCMPAVVKECHTDQQSVEQLLSETSQLRDNLETEFCTAILPGPSTSCVSIQGTSELAVVGTVERIQAVMAPPDLPQPQPTSSSSPPLPVVTPAQSRPTPPSTAGTFSPSPPPSSTAADLRDRVTPHQFPNIPTPTAPPRHLPGSERENIVQRIAYEIEQQKDSDVVSRGGVDSSHREQTIHYFLRLNFPRERIEAVVDSMGPWADTDDILKRLNSLHVTSPRPVASLSSSRSYTSNGEPVLNANVALRPVVIDGSNVAMRHGNGRVFSCRGIQIAVDWFHQRGHKEITVFVPQWRKETPRAEYPITDQEILNKLEREGILKFTPSRRIGNKKIVCYDDRFIVRLASETNGVIVSNDNFRDLAEENEKWRKTIENRLVMFTFAHDIFMVPEDPLGKYGPRLSQLLQIEPTKSSSKGGAQQDQSGPAVCPYGERCTFGRRCRFAHPEREGRLDPSLLTSRSPNTSPAPSESRRHTDTVGDVQKDGSSSHSSSDRGSPSGPQGQPTSSPQRPRTSPAQTEMSYGQQPLPQQVPHGYSQPQPPSGYPSQPMSSENIHYSHSQPHQLRDFVQPPQYLGIPGSHGGSLSPPPPAHSSALQSSPLHSGPSTPMADGISAYPSRTFPMANLSLVRQRNVTDRIQSSPIANGGEDFGPTAPNGRPIVPPHHSHAMDSLSRLVPRGDFPPAQFQGPPPHSNPSYNWSSANGVYHHHHRHHPAAAAAAYHMPHAANTYQPPSHHYVSSGEQLQHMTHRSPGRTPHHAGDYSSVPHGGHLPPPPTNAYQNLQSSSTVENGPYLQEDVAAAMLQRPHHHPHGGAGHPDYRYAHRRGPEHQAMNHQGPRAASMYGDMGLRLTHEKVALADKFQASQSSPDLYYTNGPHHHQQKPSAVSDINWPLFKLAQARLPNQEKRIMDTMLQHPQADLDQLVDLIQNSR